jgi:hypothetical protein
VLSKHKTATKMLLPKYKSRSSNNVSITKHETEWRANTARARVSRGKNFKILAVCASAPCGTLIDFNELNWLRVCASELRAPYPTASVTKRECFIHISLEKIRPEKESHLLSVEFLCLSRRRRHTSSRVSRELEKVSRYQKLFGRDLPEM